MFNPISKLRHNNVKKTLTFLSQTSFIASIIARLTTYCTSGTTRPSSICIVNEKSRQPFGDSQTFFDLPAKIITIIITTQLQRKIQKTAAKK